MKISRLIPVLLLSVLAISCSAQKTLTEVSSMDGVNSVYISKAMLRLGGLMTEVESASGDIDLTELIDKMSSVEIISCEQPHLIPMVDKKVQEIVGRYPLELLSEVKDDDDVVEIYASTPDDGKTYNMLLIRTKDSTEIMYTLIKGNIDFETLMEAIDN